MATCPKGHESTTADYCDQCGAPMPGTSTPAPPAAVAPPAVAPAAPPADPVAGTPCPVCNTPRTGRFCEEDGYDFLLAPPVTATSPSTSPTGAAVPAAGRETAAGPPSPATPAALVVVVGTDRGYFDAVLGMGGEDADALTFPRFAAERRFPLVGQQLLIGRSSRSRGIHPDIDLSGPPEDPGVSHTHALLVLQPDGWAVVDLGSSNGTYLNDPHSAPVPAETPVPIAAGDRVFVGAWTCLSIRPA
ncbi:FHA domain-containing protein [Micromonospora sp. NPDC047738]|uniref:FHA domain-containing protein n=1 Tax=Micromonospora sp. NPDC047738 TaxID=3155741 RepID=UPI003407B1F6